MTTVMSAEIEKASAVLLEFMSAMKEWENKFATLYKRENGGPKSMPAKQNWNWL